ncbi:type II secretion system F family protein [Vibrio astriarenae]|uniref:type II secretion system F family protein n=1 Tax=Vibrio astriarenae TaxID=1481923 RepID=UPI003735E5C9
MEWLQNTFADYELNDQVVFLGLILFSTIALVMSVFVLVFGNHSPVREKLKKITLDGNESESSRRFKVDATLESLAPITAPSSLKERASVRLQLMHAGYHEASALNTFYAIKAISTILGFLGAASVYFVNSDASVNPLLIIVPIAVGLYLPNVGLYNLSKKRKSKIRAAVPDALDLLVVCTEAGLGFNAALKRVGEELVVSHPEFADEINTVCAKIKAGKEMPDAFHELVERTGVYEISGLVSMLSHASRIGGSLSQTLRDYTDDYRDRRTQEVEEIAAKIPTKMLFPLLFFIWPCFFIVAVGPSLISLSDVFGL